MNLPEWWLSDKPYVIADCVETMKSMPENSVDLVVTSPPYNLGIDYGESYNDKQEWDKYYEWCEQWLKEIYRILKPDGKLCLNHYLSVGNSKNRYTPLMTLNLISEQIGFKHHSIAIWTDITLVKLTAWGSWLSASSPYINSPYEGILILYKDHWKKDNPGENTISKEDFMKGCSGVWNIKTESVEGHPAPYPVELPKLCTELLTFKNEIVFDPFLGSGTTLLATRLTNRIGLGCEINPAYEKEIKSRAMTNISDLQSFGVIL